MIYCLLKLSYTFLKLVHGLVRQAVSVQVPTAMTRSSQCGWRPRLSLGSQPIRTIASTSNSFEQLCLGQFASVSASAGIS